MVTSRISALVFGLLLALGAMAGPVLAPGPRFRPTNDPDIRRIVEQLKAGQFADAEAGLAKLPPAKGKSAAALELDAWLKANRGDFAAAEKSARMAVAIDPKLSLAQFLLGEILFLQGRIEEAKSQFAISAATPGADRSYLLYLARIAVMQGDSQTAVRHLKTLMPPTTPAGRLALVELVEQAARRGDLTQASSLARQCGTGCVDTAEHFLAGGLVAEASRDYPKAESEYRKAIEKDGQSVAGWMGLASVQSATKDLAAAERSLEKVRSMPGGAESGAIALARLKIQNRDLNGAIAVLKPLTEGSRRAPPEALILLSEAYAANQNGDGAYKTLVSLVKTYPSFAPGFLLLGKLQMSFRNVAEADRRFREASELEPRLDEAWVFRSNIAFSNHKLLEAEHLLREGLSFSPNSPLLHFHLGVVLEHDRRWSAAAEEFRKAYELQPSMIEAMNNRAVNLARLNRDLPEAEALLRKVVGARRSPQPLGNLGYVLILKGDAAGGIKLLDEAIQADPQNAEFYFFRSVGYRKLGNASEADRQQALATKTGFPANYLTDGENRSPRLTYICPMDKDVSSPDPSKCPRCQMKLVPKMPGALEYRVQVNTAPAMVSPGTDTTYRFRMFEKDSNRPVARFETIHEKPLHLFYVDETLTKFGHEHPELLPDGTFEWKTKLDQGNYRFFLDFFPFGGTPQMLTHRVAVGRAPSATLQIAPDVSNKQSVNLGAGLDPGSSIAAGKNSRVLIRVNTTEGLETYLGAWSHMLIVSEDLREVLHAHPSAFSAGVTEFNLTLSRPVNYRMWVQFQRYGKVNTFQFTLPLRAPAVRAAN